MRFEIEDFALSIVFALLGAVFVSNFFINFISGMNAFVGVLFDYIVFIILIVILSNLGLIVMAIKIKKPKKFIGALLITFALVIVMNWGNVVDLHSCTLAGEQCINPFNFHSIDGLFYAFYTAIIGFETIAKQNLIKVLTYIFTPFILAFAGGLLTKGAPEVSPI